MTSTARTDNATVMEYATNTSQPPKTGTNPSLWKNSFYFVRFSGF